MAQKGIHTKDGHISLFQVCLNCRYGTSCVWNNSPSVVGRCTAKDCVQSAGIYSLCR